MVEIDLGPDAPATIVDAAPHIPGLRLTSGGGHAELRADGRRWRLLVRRAWPDAAQTKRSAAELAQDAQVAGDMVIALVADLTLPHAIRKALEDQGISYVDGTGALHIVAPGVLVHVQQPEHRRTTWAAHGLGAATVRTVQVLLEEPAREWTVSGLAGAADLSLGQTHNLWTLLQREGLAVTRRTGRETRRAVRDPRLLLEWLAAQRPARRVHEQLGCALYANTLARLCAKATQALDASAVPHAWTGAAAAALQQAGPTAVPQATVRVDPDRPLREVAQALGAEPTDRGANLVLYRDVGRLGIHSGHRHSTGGAEVPLAPPVRVYLDLLGERRGEDAAAHYREAIIGY